MNPPQVYMCSPSWTLLPPPSPYHPSGLSQCTSPKHPVSCIKPGLATRYIYDIIRISMPFSHIIPPSPSPTESKRRFYTSVSLLLSRIQGYYLLGSVKQKKQQGLVSRSCQYHTPSAAPLPTEMPRCSPVLWSSVLTLLYQWGLVRKTEPHCGRGSSMQGISYADDKRGRKSSKGKMVVCETTQGLSKAGSCSHPQGWRDSGRQRLH